MKQIPAEPNLVFGHYLKFASWIKYANQVAIYILGICDIKKAMPTPNKKKKKTSK